MDLKQIIEETIETDWKNLLFSSLSDENEKLKQFYDKTIFPPNNQIFRAFSKFNIQDTKVVIIGQDPYPSIDKNTQKPFACGLSFAIQKGQKIAPSFRNICNEMYRCYKNKRSDNPELTDLVDQGVLLLNRSLTVVKDEPNSHKNIWKKFTNNIIEYISRHCKNVVFILWGRNAQELEDFIEPSNHYILKWTHPSPLSRRPFVGNNHFVLANDYLEKHNRSVIKWC